MARGGGGKGFVNPFLEQRVHQRFFSDFITYTSPGDGKRWHGLGILGGGFNNVARFLVIIGYSVLVGLVWLVCGCAMT